MPPFATRALLRLSLSAKFHGRWPHLHNALTDPDWPLDPGCKRGRCERALDLAAKFDRAARRSDLHARAPRHCSTATASGSSISKRANQDPVRPNSFEEQSSLSTVRSSTAMPVCCESYPVHLARSSSVCTTRWYRDFCIGQPESLSSSCVFHVPRRCYAFYRTRSGRNTGLYVTFWTPGALR